MKSIDRLKVSLDFGNVPLPVGELVRKNLASLYLSGPQKSTSQTPILKLLPLQ